MPSKRIIILDRLETSRPTYRVAFWADVPAARQSFYADGAGASQWRGASAAENAALQGGAVVERVESISMLPGATLADIQAILIDRWTAFQAEIGAANPWIRYGTVWDGTAWTAGGVA